MTTLFLDHDGVLLPLQSDNKRLYTSKFNEYELFDKKCVAVLNKIISNYDVQIVVTSDWRLYFDLEELCEIYQVNGILTKPIAITLDLQSNRVLEIQTYIQTNNIENYVVIDDLDLSIENFVKCSKAQTEGIKQSGIYDKIIKLIKCTT